MKRLLSTRATQRPVLFAIVIAALTLMPGRPVMAQSVAHWESRWEPCDQNGQPVYVDPNLGYAYLRPQATGNASNTYHPFVLFYFSFPESYYYMPCSPTIWSHSWLYTGQSASVGDLGIGATNYSTDGEDDCHNCIWDVFDYSTTPATVYPITGSVQAQMNVTLRGYMKHVPVWIDEDGNPSDPPAGAPPPPQPGHVKVLVDSYLYTHARPAEGTGQARVSATSSFGQSVSAAAPPPGSTPVTSDSSRKYLVRAPATGNIATVIMTSTLQGNATGSGPKFERHGASAEARITASYKEDRRAAYISSSIDTTHKCGGAPEHQPVRNDRRPDGTISADTVRPPLLWQTIEYHAQLEGDWTNGYPQYPAPSYHWNSSLMGNWYEDFFNPPVNPIRPFRVAYYPDVNTAQQEHVHLRVRDARDGAEATANYYVTFHEPIEHWRRDGNSPLIHPLPTNGPINHLEPGDWNTVGPIVGSGSWSYTLSQTQTMRTEGQITTSRGAILGAETNLARLTFSTEESITLGQEFSTVGTQSYTLNLQPGHRYYIFWGPGWEERRGRLCNYEDQGFHGVGSWRAMVPQSLPGGGLAIRWHYVETEIRPGGNTGGTT